MKSASSLSIGGTNGAGGLAAQIPSSSSPLAAQLLSASAANLENRDNLLLTNKSNRSTRLLKIPDYPSLRKELLYPLREEVGQTAQSTQPVPKLPMINNPTIAIASNETNYVKSHVRFDKGGDDVRADTGVDFNLNDDATTRSSYSSDDTSDLVSEARSYAEIDDERAEIMRTFFGEARYQRDYGTGVGIGMGGAMTTSAVSFRGGSSNSSGVDGHGTRKQSTVFRDFDYYGHYEEG